MRSRANTTEERELASGAQLGQDGTLAAAVAEAAPEEGPEAADFGFGGRAELGCGMGCVVGGGRVAAGS